ncbi:MAG: hypothetical protein Q7J31_04385 [Syntrophales bacterium]|nr:hypothetical protein [Syntrophales bacterium]
MLLDILSTKNKLTVLRELCQHKGYQYSITELAEKTKIHRVRLFTIINELEQAGVVDTLRKGKVRLISINERNYYVKEILTKSGVPLSLPLLETSQHAHILWSFFYKKVSA